MSAKPKISIEQLRSSLIDRPEGNKTLLDIVRPWGFNTSKELAVALSDLLNIPFIEIPEEYHIERSVIRLVPANPTVPVLEFAEDRVRVQGVVIGVLRRF